MASDRGNLSRKMAAIVHADVTGSTALVQLDEALAHERINDAFNRFSQSIKQYGGTVHEIRGDALVAEFSRASDAVCAALAFQKSHSQVLDQLDDEITPRIRIGVSLGEVVFADGQATGAGVVLAQRVEQLAEPGGLTITGAVHEMLPQHLPIDQNDLGEQEVKGFDESVRVYAVQLKQGSELPKPVVASETKKTSAVQWVMVAGVVVMICGGGLLAWLQPWQPDFEPASVEKMAFPLPDEASIAVLPFKNLSDDAEQEYFSDGITNDIITDLSRMKDLFVIASNSTFAYKNKPVKVQQVAEELGVRYILEGSVQITSDKVRINAQLIDATTGRHLWADRYDRDAEDLFAVQTEIIEMIVATLAFKVDTVERERVLRKDTENLAAYELYRRGREAFFIWTKEDMARAREFCERAIELDPNYSKPYALMARVLGNQARYGWVDDPDGTRDLAVEMGLKAVTLNPDDYYSHWELGGAYMFQGDFDRAIAEYERALDLNSNDADLLAEMIELLALVGREEEAVASIKHAMRINPHYPDWYLWNLGWTQYVAGQYEDALSALNRMSNPPNGVRRTQAAVLVRMGRIEEAREVMTKFIETGVDMTLEDMEASKWRNREAWERWIADLRVAGLPEKRSLPLPDKPSIAVLPFTNMSDDPQQEYFVDGMTEDLITDLSKISGLFVIARNSSFTYKGKAVDVKNVARDLGVRYVLEGSVRRAGDQVRINAQLIDATTGGHLWAERYDGVLQDIFALQDQVTQQIVNALAVNLTDEEQIQQTQHGTDNAEAHDAFLQGWVHYKLGTPEDLSRSIPHFEEAIRLDAEYAQAHAALAAVYWDAYQNDWAFDLDIPSFRAERWANDHLEQALKKPTPLAHAVQADIFASFGLQNQAVEEAEKAVALDPNNATAVAGLANALVLAERVGEGLKLIQDAMRLDPHYPPGYLITLGAAQFGMENYEEAAETFQRAVKRNPQNELPRIYLASSYGHLGRINDAEEVIESANDLRASLGMGDLSLERKVVGSISPFKGEIDFKRFGGKAAQERVRAGLSDIPALKWQYLVTVHQVLGAGNTWFEIEGATEIDVATAKAFHDRGVPFIDTSTEAEGVWKNGRVPGAINLPYARSPDDLTKKRFRHSTLSEIVNKTDEFVLYWWIPGGNGYPSYEAAKAISWGYEKVYYFVDGIKAWKEAGYPVEKDE